MHALARHPTPFMCHINNFSGVYRARGGVSELVAMFTAMSSITLMSNSALPLRTTRSVAEQEGQPDEMETTGAPQKPSYTKSVWGTDINR